MDCVLRSRGRPLALLCAAWLAATGCAEGTAGVEETPWTPPPPPRLPWETDAGTDEVEDAGIQAPPVTPQDAGSEPPPPPMDAAAEEPADAGEPAVELDAASPDPDPEPEPEPDAGAGECAPGTTQCGNSCVDLNTSANHCGACGHRCPGGAACNGQGVCTSPNQNCRYAQFDGHDYLFCSDARNWTQARSRCLSWGLDLAIINGQAENAFVTGDAPRWIGLNDRNSRDFRWVVPGNEGAVNGAAPSFTAWGKDEPNNSRSCQLLVFNCTTEDCGEVRADGTWNDRQCNVTQGYVCESY